MCSVPRKNKRMWDIKTQYIDKHKKADPVYFNVFVRNFSIKWKTKHKSNVWLGNEKWETKLRSWDGRKSDLKSKYLQFYEHRLQANENKTKQHQSVFFMKILLRYCNLIFAFFAEMLTIYLEGFIEFSGNFFFANSGFILLSCLFFLFFCKISTKLYFTKS